MVMATTGNQFLPQPVQVGGPATYPSVTPIATPAQSIMQTMGGRK